MNHQFINDPTGSDLAPRAPLPDVATAPAFERITVRQATLADVLRISELCSAAVRATATTNLHTPDEHESWLDSVSGEEGKRHVTVAIKTGTAIVATIASNASNVSGAAESIVVGYVHIHPWEATISSFYVDPAFQGRGVGRKLLAHSNLNIRAAHGNQTQVRVEASLPSVPFYGHLGFKPVSAEPILLADRFGRDVRFRTMTKNTTKEEN